MVIEEVIGILVILCIFILLIKGGIQTFQRNWVLALLLILFIAPIWVGWAFVEIFMSKPVKQPIQVQMQPIEVTVNQNNKEG